MALFSEVFSEYAAALSRAHRNVRLFFAASFLYQLGTGFSSVLYNLYIRGLGYPDTVAGAYVAASSLAGALSLIPAGIIANKIGQRKSIVISVCLVACIAVIQAFVKSVPVMIVGAFLEGMVGSVLWVSALPLLAQNTEKVDRLHLFSLNFGLSLAAQVGGSIGAGSMADILQHWGLSSVWSIRWTLLTGALVTACAVFAYAKMENPAVVERVVHGLHKTALQFSTKKRSLVVTWTAKWQRYRTRPAQLKLIAKFTITSTLIGFGAGLVIPYLNLYFADRFHLLKSQIGLVIALGQLLTAATMFIGPSLAKRIGPVRAVVGLQLMSIPFLLVTGWATSSFLAAGAVIVRQACMNASNPIQDSIMMTLVDDDLKSFAVSCGQTAFMLGWAIMGPISTSIVRHHGAYNGYVLVFSMTACLYLVGSIFYGWAFGKYQRHIQHELTSAVAL